jgi:Leucine-rich repeat (LRR) protein
MEEKILHLIKTGNEVNIKLAFQLIKATRTKIDFSTFEELYQWLLQHSLVKSYKQIQKKILEIFKINDLYDLTVNSLPQNIHLLPNLTDVYLPNNKLQYCPASIGELKKLENIDFSNNQFTHLLKRTST